jgi:hypothetical protein
VPALIDTAEGSSGTVRGQGYAGPKIGVAKNKDPVRLPRLKAGNAEMCRRRVQRRTGGGIPDVEVIQAVGKNIPFVRIHCAIFIGISKTYGTWTPCGEPGTAHANPIHVVENIIGGRFADVLESHGHPFLLRPYGCSFEHIFP